MAREEKMSTEPIPERCGAKLRNSDLPEYCERHPVAGADTLPASRRRKQAHLEHLSRASVIREF